MIPPEHDIEAAVAEFVGQPHFRGVLTQDRPRSTRRQIFVARPEVPVEATPNAITAFSAQSFRRRFPEYFPRIEIASPQGVLVTFLPKSQFPPSRARGAEEEFEIRIYFDPEPEKVPIAPDDESVSFWDRLGGEGL